MVDLNKIESLYKSHSESIEIPPPPDAWNRIEASLNKQGSKNRALWIWVSGIAASLLVVVSFSTMIWLSNKPDNPTTLTNNHLSTETSTIKEATLENKNNDSEVITDKEYENINNNLSQSRFLAGLSSEKNNSSGVSSINRTIKSDLIVPYRHSNIHSLNNYFATDKIEIKKIKSEHPDMKWEDFYVVDTENLKTSNETTRFGSRFEIGGVYSPVYAYRQTSVPSSSSSYMASASDPSEKGLVYSGGGIRLNVMVNKKWSVESGVRFARLGQEVNSQVDVEQLYASSTSLNESKTTIKRVSMVNSMGNISHNNTNVSTNKDLFFATSSPNYRVEFNASNTNTNSILEQNLDYIEVPLTIRYYLINNGMSLSLSAGLSSNWLVSNDVYLWNGSNREYIGQTSGLASMTLSTHAGLAFSVPIMGRLSLQVEPRINYFLSEINKDYHVAFKPYSFGFYSGVQYTFGK